VGIDVAGGWASAVSRHLIEALGGRFGIDSASGEGTRLWAEVRLE
jgi:hypothetical protein